MAPGILQLRIALLVVASFLAPTAAAHGRDEPPLLWPLPLHMDAEGPPLPLHDSFAITHDGVARGSSARLPATVARFMRTVAALRSAAPPLRRSGSGSLRQLTVVVADLADADAPPTVRTDYSYTLRVGLAGNATLAAPSVFGAIYGLESFVHLLQPQPSLNNALALPHAAIEIRDAPQYRWRGVMVDTGRRFFPVSLLENLMETMSQVKMNVLHVHASDYCRWSVESKIYPELTKTDVTGTSPGAYTQQEIRDLVKFAADRGIRVIPEFDLPGHARALVPLANRGLKFCGGGPNGSHPTSHANQIMHDEGNSSLTVLTTLLGEMAALFPDEVFNIGADEVQVEAGCTPASMQTLEDELLTAVRGINKTAMGWEQLIWSRNDTIINSYGSLTAAEVVSRGHLAVESSSPHWYFTHPPGWCYQLHDGTNGTKVKQEEQWCGFGCKDAAGWSMCHHDPGHGVSPELVSMVLGGSVSMWTDDYVFPAECNAFPGRVPANGSVFYDR